VIVLAMLTSGPTFLLLFPNPLNLPMNDPPGVCAGKLDDRSGPDVDAVLERSGDASFPLRPLEPVLKLK
jgi:hypothetical protein